MTSVRYRTIRRLGLATRQALTLTVATAVAHPVDAQTRVRGAVRNAADGGALEHVSVTSAGLRVRHVASRAASEDDAVRALGLTVWEVHAEVHVRNARFFETVDNLPDVAWNEAQFATTSRLPGEAGGITELHYTPGAPCSLQAGVGYRF